MIRLFTCEDELEVTHFNLDHNHDLVSVTHRKHLRSNRNVLEGEACVIKFMVKYS